MIIKKRVAVVVILAGVCGSLGGYLCDLTILYLNARLAVEISFAAFIGVFSVLFTMPWWLKSKY